MNAYKFITSGRYVEVGLFLVYKKCIRYPYILNELWTDGQRLHAVPLFIAQSWIRPELAKVKIQGEVLCGVGDTRFALVQGLTRGNVGPAKENQGS